MTLPERPLVLVVDDYEDVREMYADYLASVGYRVEVAFDGPSALAAARGHLPALIVMDMSLPRVDGWDVTATLKGDATTRHIRIIALTGHGEARYRARAERAGCDAFLVKPCTPSELAASVAMCLEPRAPNE